MARFGVYRIKDGSVLVVDCQADTLDIGRRLMVPLWNENDVPARIPRLHPLFVLDGQRMVLATHRMSSVPNREIGRQIASLSLEADRIMDAIDYLLTGY